MPFTPSHAVVALPFVRTPLVPAAIAIGAMAPDLPLFLRGIGLSYSVTHSWAWLAVTTAVAAGLLLVWRMVLRPAVRELSPMWLARRLPQGWDQDAAATMRETFPSLRCVLLLVVSLAIGVASHILWDAFTHEGRAGVTLLPILDEQWGPLLGFKWLQYASGVVGLVIIGVWALLRLRRTDAVASVDRVLPTWARLAWWVSLPLILAAAWVGGWMLWGPFTDEFTPAHLVYRVLPPAAGMWGMLTLALAVVAQVVRSRTHRA